MRDSQLRFVFLGGLELRVRSAAEIVDSGFRLYRRHFLFLVALSAVPNMLAAPVFLWLSGLLTPAWAIAPEEAFTDIIGRGLMWLVTGWVVGIQLVLTLILGGAAMHSIAMGERPTLGGTLRKVLARWPSVLWAALGHAAILTLFCFATCMKPLIVAIYGTFCCLFAHIMFFEDQRLIPALKRSARLCGHYFLHVFMVLLITYGLFSKVVEYAITVPILLGNLMRHGLLGGQGQVFYGLLGAGKGIAQTVSWPLVTVALTILYYDLLMRREGLDLQLRTLQRESARPPISRQTARAKVA